jgi:hypothetical protein
MRTVPASLNVEVLQAFYRKHGREALIARIPALLKEHGFLVLCEKLEEKYKEHPAEAWHASLRRARVLYDFPENNHPMQGPLELQSGAIVLRAGEEVCITDASRPAPGWCLGYSAAVANPKIGTFPLAFTSAGGATSTKQSERGNLKVRARRPRSADVLEHASLGERAPVVASSVPAHWGPQGSASSSARGRRRGPKGCSGTGVPTASGDPAWAQYRENLGTHEHTKRCGVSPGATLRNSRKSCGEQSALTPWRGEAWGESSGASTEARGRGSSSETMQPLVGSSHGLGGGEQRKPTRGGGSARAMAHHPRTDGHTQRVAMTTEQSRVRFAAKPPRFTAEQRQKTRALYKEPADEPGPEPEWADDLVVTVRYIPTLYASTDTPNSVTLVADDDVRISEIKLMLQRQLGVAANRMRLAHGETGEVLQDGKTLKDYGISSDITLDGIWSFKDQTHNPQLAQGLQDTDERHQWSYARHGRHQPLQVARGHAGTREGKAAAIAIDEYEAGRQSAPTDGETTYEGGWYSGSNAGRAEPHGFPGGYYGDDSGGGAAEAAGEEKENKAAWTGAGAVGLRQNPAHFL